MVPVPGTSTTGVRTSWGQGYGNSGYGYGLYGNGGYGYGGYGYGIGDGNGIYVLVYIPGMGFTLMPLRAVMGNMGMGGMGMGGGMGMF